MADELSAPVLAVGAATDGFLSQDGTISAVPFASVPPGVFARPVADEGDDVERTRSRAAPQPIAAGQGPVAVASAGQFAERLDEPGTRRDIVVDAAASGPAASGPESGGALSVADDDGRAPTGSFVSRSGTPSLAAVRGHTEALRGEAGCAGAALADSELRRHGLYLADAGIGSVARPGTPAAVESGAAAKVAPSPLLDTTMAMPGAYRDQAAPPSGRSATGVVSDGDFGGTLSAEAASGALARASVNLPGEHRREEEAGSRPFPTPQPPAASSTAPAA